ncbi:MAG: tRNA (adenosine(37)-N6)-threonylcarbamoyltransferase complex ATPase subunit type 1 TsaE [Acidobacteriota bacterium]
MNWNGESSPAGRTFHCRDEQETIEAGREIARDLPADVTVNLVGDLGAGKTFLVRAMAESLGAELLDVNSPSFALIHEYPRKNATPIIHIDGYRLSDRPHEWEEIGIPELLRARGPKFIEWPKQGFRTRGQRQFTIAIQVNADDSRTITVDDSSALVGAPSRSD